MKILLITAYYPPFNAVGSVRLGKLVNLLEANSHEVHVISCEHGSLNKSMNIYEKAENVHFVPTLKFLEHLRYLFSTKKTQNFNNLSEKSFFSKFVRSLLLFPDRFLFWGLKAGALGLAKHKKENFGLIIASGLPATALVVAMILSKKTGVPWLADLRDPWSDNPYNVVFKWRQVLDKIIERATLTSAAGIFTVSEPIRASLKDKYNVPVFTCLNGLDWIVPTDTPSMLPDKQKLMIVYTGKIYTNRRTPEPLFAALSANQQLHNQVEIHFFGPYHRDVPTLVKKYNLISSVFLHGNITYSQSLRVQQSADLLLLLPGNGSNDVVNMTGKLFEYFSALRPILCIGNQNSAAAKLIAENGFGLVSNDENKISQLLFDLCSEKRVHGVIKKTDKSSREKFHYSKTMLPFVDFIKSLAISSTPRPRVTLVLNALQTGGTEKHILQLITQLRDRVSFSVMAFEGGDLESKYMEACSVKVIAPANIFYPLKNFLMFVHIFFNMLKNREHIFHFFLPRPYIIGGLAGICALHKRMIMSRRSLNYYMQDHFGSSILEKLLHKRMIAVVGNSSAVCNQLQNEDVPQERCRLIYNAVPAPKVPKPSLKNHLRKKYKVPSNAIVIAILANLYPYKGHRDFLDSITRLRADVRKRIFVIFAGEDKGELSVLKRQVQKTNFNKNIVFLGQVNATDEIWNITDVGVSSSHHEGFSNSVLEGMSYGVPFILTAVGGNLDITKFTEAVVSVPPKSPELMANAIEFLATDDKARGVMGKISQSTVLKEFNLEKMKNEYLALYRWAED